MAENESDVAQAPAPSVLQTDAGLVAPTLDTVGAEVRDTRNEQVEPASHAGAKTRMVLLTLCPACARKRRGMLWFVAAILALIPLAAPALLALIGVMLSAQGLALTGVYVFACYPTLGCLYVGISDNVQARIRRHLNDDKEFSQFMRSIFADACGFRLDILVPPDVEDKSEWLVQTEKALIYHFSPTFNVANNSYTNTTEVQQYE